MSRASGASKRRTTAASRYPGSRCSSSFSTVRLSQRIERMFAHAADGRRLTALLATRRNGKRTRPARVPVLAQVDALPGAEGEAPIRYRDRQRCVEQRRLDVGGHVVRTLERV